MNTEITAPIRTTQRISTLKSSAKNATIAIIACEISHCILDAKLKVTEARSPTKEHRMPLTAMLNLGDLLNLIVVGNRPYDHQERRQEDAQSGNRASDGSV